MASTIRSASSSKIRALRRPMGWGAVLFVSLIVAALGGEAPRIASADAVSSDRPDDAATPSVNARLEQQLDAWGPPTPPPASNRSAWIAQTRYAHAHAPQAGDAGASVPGGASIADHRAAFDAAAAHEAEALRLGRAAPPGDAPSDAELRQLTDAILAYEKIAAATGAGEAYAAAQHGVARCEYRIGRLHAAHTALERSFPADYDALKVTARVSLQGMIADALFARCHRRVPGGWGADADASRGVTGYAAAREVYRAVVVNDRLHPRAARALVRYGQCALALKDPDAAEAAFRQAIVDYARGPDVFEARVRLAETLLSRHPEKVPPEVDREVEILLAEAGYDEASMHAWRRRDTPDLPPPSPSERRRMEENAHAQADALAVMTAQGPVLASASSGRGAALAPTLRPEDAARALRPVSTATESTPGTSIERVSAARDESRAAEKVRQAQVFLRQSNKTGRASAKFMLEDVVARYPSTPSAEVARSLLAAWR